MLLAKLLLLGWMCVLPLLGQKPGQVDPLTLDQTDPRCWESSSARLLKMPHYPRLADTVPDFWDLMVFLRASEKELFWDLARVFWDTYMHCVLSRTHGLGRRQLTWPHEHITAMRSLITDKSFVRDSQTNFSKLEFFQAWLKIQVQRIGPHIRSHVISRAKDKMRRARF